MLLAFSCSFLTHCSTLPFDSDDEDGVFLLQQKSTARRSRPKRSTALFVAGLEGSGHHLWYDMVQAMYEDREHGTLPFQLRQTWLPPSVVDKATGSERIVSWQCEHRWKEEDLDLGVELFGNITNHVGHYGDEGYDEGAIWITPEACLSYPCGAGSHDQKRNDFIPRADWLAKAAALAGVDLHVAFLYRPFEELLLSNCIHRQIEETCDLYADTLISNAGALLGQLRAMDAMPIKQKPFVQCLRYGELDAFPQGLGNLFNHKMEFDSILGQIWKPNSTDWNQDHHYGENPRDLVSNWDDLVESLQSMDAQLKAACDNADS
jgi:hypothetical protein